MGYRNPQTREWLTNKTLISCSIHERKNGRILLMIDVMTNSSAAAEDKMAFFRQWWIASLKA
jgi:hypothetical protein